MIVVTAIPLISFICHFTGHFPSHSEILLAYLVILIYHIGVRQSHKQLLALLDGSAP